MDNVSNVTFCFQEGATRYEIKRSRFVIIF